MDINNFLYPLIDSFKYKRMYELYNLLIKIKLNNKK